MSGARLPIKACPECGTSSARGTAGVHRHCPDAKHGHGCTWIICICGTTYDEYTGRRFREPK